MQGLGIIPLWLGVPATIGVATWLLGREDVAAVEEYLLGTKAPKLRLPSPPPPTAPVSMVELTQPGAFTPEEVSLRTNREHGLFYDGFAHGMKIGTQAASITDRDALSWPLWAALGLGTAGVLLMLRS